MKKLGVIVGGIFLFTLVFYYKGYFSTPEPTPVITVTSQKIIGEDKVLPPNTVEISKTMKVSKPESPSDSPSEIHFKELLQAGEKFLPTQVEFSQLTNEEAHGHPERLREGAIILGDIAQALKDDPTLIPQALPFYEKCAKRTDLSRPVRALCFADLSQLDPQNPRLAEMVSPEISDLAKKLL